MTEKVEFVPLKEAREEVQNAVIMSAIKHLAFAKVIVEELGEARALLSAITRIALQLNSHQSSLDKNSLRS